MAAATFIHSYILSSSGLRVGWLRHADVLATRMAPVQIAKKYFEKVGMTSRVQLLAADGALEAAPQVGAATQQWAPWHVMRVLCLSKTADTAGMQLRSSAGWALGI